MKSVCMQLQHQLIQKHFMAFLEKSFMTVSPGQAYLPNWHLEAIAAHLEACERGDIRRLIINMPPRMLKSVTVSVAWPAWLLAKRPSTRLMVASYAQSLSEKHSLDCRLVMQSPWYRRIFPATNLVLGQNEKHKYVTSKRGHRIAVSVGGAATGEGGDVLIVDDPLNPTQAMQRSARDAANDWFRHTFVSRLDNKRTGVIVLVMQRLHEDDLTGVLLKAGGWEHLNLPAIAEEKEVIQRGEYKHVREIGEVLHAAREDMPLLMQTKEELGSTHFAAQYQQRPRYAQSRFMPLEWFVRYELESML